MKTPFLMITATILALTVTSAFAGGAGTPEKLMTPEEFRAHEARQRPGFRESVRNDLRRLKYKATHTDHREPGEDQHVRDGIRLGVNEAWDRLRDAGRDVRDGVFESVETIKAVSRDMRHERPLLMSEYVTAVKKGKEVSLIYCESRIKKMANAQRCEKLHAGTFKIDELKSCINKVEGDKQPGMILNRNLKTVAESDYGHDHFKMYDSKASYQDYLAQCKAALAKIPGRSIAARPLPRPAATHAPEFKPFEAPSETMPFEIPAENSGNL